MGYLYPGAKAVMSIDCYLLTLPQREQSCICSLEFDRGHRYHSAWELIPQIQWPHIYTIITDLHIWQFYLLSKQKLTQSNLNEFWHYFSLLFRPDSDDVWLYVSFFLNNQYVPPWWLATSVLQFSMTNFIENQNKV